MDNSELKKLKRKQVLELLLDEMEANEKLQEEIARLKEELNARRMQRDEMGSLAEAAATALNQIFENATRATTEFLDYVHQYAADSPETEETPK